MIDYHSFTGLVNNFFVPFGEMHFAFKIIFSKTGNLSAFQMKKLIPREVNVLNSIETTLNSVKRTGKPLSKNNEPVNQHNKLMGKRKRMILVNWQLYLLMFPVLLYFIIFQYLPIGGLIIAFKEFTPALGIFGSKWVGLENFIRFFHSYNCLRVILNTFTLNILQLIFAFPIPIILALMINELGNKAFKKTVQTITYAPHFISTVVMVGMLTIFLNPTNGLINTLLVNLGGKSINFMIEPAWFKPLYILSGIWQNTGWDSILYIAALAAIDPQLYEAAEIDGANRLQRIWHVNIPGILSTIIIILILNTGKLMNVGFEKAFLMQNDPNMIVSDVISTFVYRTGLVNGEYSYSTAIGMFNSVLNLILLASVNHIVKLMDKDSGIY